MFTMYYQGPLGPLLMFKILSHIICYTDITVHYKFQLFVPVTMHRHLAGIKNEVNMLIHNV